MRGTLLRRAPWMTPLLTLDEHNVNSCEGLRRSSHVEFEAWKVYAHVASAAWVHRADPQLGPLQQLALPRLSCGRASAEGAAGKT